MNRQRSVRVPLQNLREFLARAMKEVRLPQDAASVCLVSNSQIAKWNAAYRGKNKPTDVLSFRAEEKSAARPNAANAKRPSIIRRKSSFARSFNSSAPSTSYLGDIAIAPAVARRNARLYERTLDQEMRILILHGILHLMGYDHETDTGQMERREQLLRRKLRIA